MICYLYCINVPVLPEIWRYDAEPTFILDGHMVFGSADGRILNDFGITPGVRFGINSLQSGQAIRLPTVRCVRSLVHIKAANMLDHPSRREKSCKFGFRFTYDALKDCFMTFHVYAMLPNTGIRNRNKKMCVPPTPCCCCCSPCLLILTPHLQH